jgi:diacylglycerol kinase (ATP)
MSFSLHSACSKFAFVFALHYFCSMKHIFIVNPHAGTENCESFVRQSVAPFEDNHDITVHIKSQIGDSYDTVRHFRTDYPDEELRFYACGGDGTLREVAIACIGVENVSFTSFACGSGNDYVKYYGGPNHFRDVQRLLEGKVVPIDIMYVHGNQPNPHSKNLDRNEDTCTTWAMNATHFGLDSRVAATMARIRRVPLIGKKMAYPTGIAVGFLTAMRNKCTVYADGEQLNKGSILLGTACNGSHVGGGYNCAPRSCNDDGLLEVCLVSPVIPRIRALSLMNYYKRGEHLDNPRFTHLVTYRRATNLTIKGPKGFYISLIRHAVRFIRPTSI